MSGEPSDREMRVLVVAPTGRDAALAVQLLSTAGISGHACEDLPTLSTELEAGAGALLISEEALSPRLVKTLTGALEQQPPWSDLPILLFASPLPTEASVARMDQLITLLGNVSVVDRPMRKITLLTAVKTALRARKRQYLTRQTLRALHDQEEGARRRADFEQHLIGIVSHDLRNPLQTVLLASSALLRREELDESVIKSAARIKSSAERAIRLIADLLDFTEARLGGGIRIHPRPVALDLLVRQVVEELEATHPERRLDVVVEGAVGGEWDPDRLGQIVTNLLTNALKYGAPEVPVTLRLTGTPQQVELSVHNGGAPIPQELRPRLFEPLSRGAQVIGKSGRSIGLGLFIVRQIVQAHGGAVQVDSDSERGTCFRVWLPRVSSASG